MISILLEEKSLKNGCFGVFWEGLDRFWIDLRKEFFHRFFVNCGVTLKWAGARKIKGKSGRFFYERGAFLCGIKDPHFAFCIKTRIFLSYTRHARKKALFRVRFGPGRRFFFTKISFNGCFSIWKWVCCAFMRVSTCALRQISLMKSACLIKSFVDILIFDHFLRKEMNIL